MKKILLKTESLSKSFSSGGVLQHVLKNIDLELYEGDFTVIMGASGAGKSTLLYALSGMDTPTLGRITFGGEVISDYNPDELAVFRRRHCGFVFQQIYLIDGMSLMDNVLAAGLLVNKDRKALAERAGELFRAVNIPEETWHKFPTQISGGEAQRVKLATELAKHATGATIYVLDEPTTGLHTADVHKLIDVLQKLVDAGNTIVVIEHNLDVIKTADYLIDLGPEGGDGGGAIVATGTPEEVAQNPASYTGQYLKPLLD